MIRPARHRRRGNAALIATFMIVPMCLLAGIGVDFGRAYVAQSRLSQSVDAAALAGGRKLSLVPDTSKTDARTYFDANFDAAKEQVALTGFDAVPQENNNLLRVTATGTMNTTFLRLAGMNTLPISAAATARRTTLGMELALVLDVTGSLDAAVGGVTAIEALKTAATKLVDILFGDKTSIGTLYVSVVPFTASVNFGADKGSWMKNGAVDAANYAPHTWRGCTEARAAPEDETDTPPVTGANYTGTVKPFTPFWFKTTLGTNPALLDNDWDTSTNGPLKATDTDDTAAKNAYTPANERTGPNLGCGQPIAGLDNDRERIKGVIKALRTSHRNGTIIPVGLQAGWMTISPKWRGLWGTNPWGSTTPNGYPLNYNADSMQKVILLITDGENNWYKHTFPAVNKITPPQPPEPDYTSYGRISEKRLGATITTIAAAKTELDKRTLRMCNTIKSNNIIIYTITVKTGTADFSQATKDLFASCATNANYYYPAPTPADLDKIFTQIGSQLSNLRLEK